MVKLWLVYKVAVLTTYDLLWVLELHLRKPSGLPKFLRFLSVGCSGETGERKACGALSTLF